MGDETHTVHIGIPKWWSSMKDVVTRRARFMLYAFFPQHRHSAVILVGGRCTPGQSGANATRPTKHPRQTLMKPYL